VARWCFLNPMVRRSVSASCVTIRRACELKKRVLRAVLEEIVVTKLTLEETALELGGEQHLHETGYHRGRPTRDVRRVRRNGTSTVANAQKRIHRRPQHRLRQQERVFHYP
jgi:hypothetical protein